MPRIGTTTASSRSFSRPHKSIVNELSRMHEGREAEKAQKEISASLFKTMGPAQKALFTSLCRTDMTAEPSMTDLMKTVTMTTTPQKALNLLVRAETGNWEGTFTEGCGHSMLSSGLLSPEANRANPGGFTVFMFHPKTVDMGAKAFDSKTASLREYFGVDVDDSTIAYYAKQCYFHPTNSHDLRIQLQTAKNMIELLTCKDSIATKGLAFILDPQRWCRLTTLIHDRFKSEPNFGSKFLYSVDRALHTFFERLSTEPALSAEDGHLTT